MQFVLLLASALFISAIGFKKFVWFISLGYGFSIAALGLVMMIMFSGNLTPVTIVLAVLFVVYGCRLGGYLLIRERKSASYQKTMKDDIKDGANTRFFLKVLVWVSCALLYCCQVSPVYFRLLHGSRTDTVTIVGAVIMACGIIFESASDYMKNQYKKQHPNRFCSHFYRFIVSKSISGW